MFIILLQRGRGGGLAGALGGAGGQSAFGTKAGDVFTRITIGVAVFWVVLSCIAIFAVTPKDLYNPTDIGGNDPKTAISTDEAAEADKPGDALGAGANPGKEDGTINLEAIQKDTKPAANTPDAETGVPDKKE